MYILKLCGLDFMPSLGNLKADLVLRWHRLRRHPNQSTVCSRCATGPLSQQSWRRMIHSREAVVYNASASHLIAGEKSGCQLCRLLVDLGVSDGPEAEIDFQVDVDPENAIDEPFDTQYLLVHARITGKPDQYMTYCMYTPTGVCPIVRSNVS